MQVILANKHNKFLKKQAKGDFNGIAKVRLFLSTLETMANPTNLSNCKKMQGYSKNIWRWRVGNYRIVAEVKDQELVIKIIEISTRENAY